jgi:hypothetical protein
MTYYGVVILLFFWYSGANSGGGLRNRKNSAIGQSLFSKRTGFLFFRMLKMKREMVDYTTVDITTLIIAVRGKRVVLDADLARIYGVPTKRLNEQVRRNTDRFPPDFAFVLTDQEVTNLRSQFATTLKIIMRCQFGTSRI